MQLSSLFVHGFDLEAVLQAAHDILFAQEEHERQTNQDNKSMWQVARSDSFDCQSYFVSNHETSPSRWNRRCRVEDKGETTPDSFSNGRIKIIYFV